MTKAELLKIAKPILFNTEMVKAILEGRKTVTRRVAKFDNYISCDEESGKYTLLEEDGGYSEGWTIQELKLNGYIKPPYHKGDILYVRETWSKDENGEYVYRTNYGTAEDDSFPPSMFKWKPSIHMPKDAARIFLKVTDVRVERLQDMCVADCVREGAEVGNAWTVNAKPNFIKLWNSTIKKQDLDRYGWKANPWVWVCEFERIEI